MGLFRKCSNLEAIDFSHCAETIFGSHTFDDCPNLKTFIAKDGKQKLLITYIYYGNVGEDKEIKLVDPKGKILDEDFYGEKMKHNSKKSK
ncbi:hypothetical protein FACS1894166_09870 [Bacilli bacterium]|nr:hypothetical protein FACS1894166_09870 [Bacilli bacterium]